METSHNRNGEVNPKYEQAAQKREFDLDAAMRIGREMQSDQMVDLTNAGDSGPPVVTEYPPRSGTRIVLSGNHRIVGAEEAMAKYPQVWEKVTDAIKESADRFGVDPSLVAPDDILVKEIPSPSSLAELESLASDLNAKRTQAFSRKGDIATRAAKVSTEMMDLVSRAMDRAGQGATIRQMLDSGEGPVLIRRLVEDRVIPIEENNTNIKNGLLTPEGKKAVVNAITGRLLKGAAPSEKVLDNVMHAASALMRADEAVPRLNALEKIRRAAEMVNEAKGKDLDTFYDQGRLAKGYERPSQELIDLAKRAKTMGSKQFSEFIRATVARLAKEPADSLFGNKTVYEFPLLADEPAPPKAKRKLKQTQAPVMGDPGAFPDWMNEAVRERVAASRNAPVMTDRNAPGQRKLPLQGSQGAPPIQAPPPKPPTGPSSPAGGAPLWKQYEMALPKEYSLNEAARAPVGRVPAVTSALSRFWHKTDGVADTSNATRMMAESALNAKDLEAHRMNLLGGEKHLRDLEKILQEHPGAEQLPVALLNRRRLTQAEKAVYDKDPAAWDAVVKNASKGLFESVRQHDAPLRKAAEAARSQGLDDVAAEFEAKRRSIGDLGPEYWPSEPPTYGEIAAKVAAQEARSGVKTNAQAERISSVKSAIKVMASHLDFHRQGGGGRGNAIRLLIDYNKELALKEAQAGLVRDIQKWIGKLPEKTAGETTKQLKSLLDHNILKTKDPIDVEAAAAVVEKMSQDPAYAAKMKDVPISRTTVARVAGAYMSTIALWTVWGNLSSVLTAGVSNVSRVIPEIGIKGTIEGVKKWADYQTSKVMEKAGFPLTPEMAAREKIYETLLGMDERAQADLIGSLPDRTPMKGKIGGILERARSAGYTGVRWMDAVAKVVSFESITARLARDNPTWTKTRVLVEAGIETAKMTDVAKAWTTSELSHKVLGRAFMLFAESPLRETEQIFRQLGEGLSGILKVAARTGIQVGAWMLIIKVLSGETNPKRAAEKLLGMFPFVGSAAKGRGPAIWAPFKWAADLLKGSPSGPAAIEQRGIRGLANSSNK